MRPFRSIRLAYIEDLKTELGPSAGSWIELDNTKTHKANAYAYALVGTKNPSLKVNKRRGDLGPGSYEIWHHDGLDVILFFDKGELTPFERARVRDWLEENFQKLGTSTETPLEEVLQ